MKIAVIGSRKLSPDGDILEKYLSGASEIVSGGAKGVDACAAEYARRNNIALTELFPRYDLYGRGAPIVRNKEIVDYADKIIVFWDGSSKGSLSVIKYAEKTGKPCEVIILGL